MKRVEMRSPATSGTAMVPEGQVERMQERGWLLVKPAKKAPPKKAAPESAKSDDDE